jgi:hypothetical protein
VLHAIPHCESIVTDQTLDSFPLLDGGQKDRRVARVRAFGPESAKLQSIHRLSAHIGDEDVTSSPPMIGWQSARLGSTLINRRPSATPSDHCAP